MLTTPVVLMYYMKYTYVSLYRKEYRIFTHNYISIVNIGIYFVSKDCTVCVAKAKSL